MKYAIVEISGRQFWMEPGKYYDFQRIPTELGKQITLNRVLLFNKRPDYGLCHFGVTIDLSRVSNSLFTVAKR